VTYKFSTHLNAEQQLDSPAALTNAFLSQPINYTHLLFKKRRKSGLGSSISDFISSRFSLSHYIICEWQSAQGTLEEIIISLSLASAFASEK
jgi:hypothetical protein